MSTNTNKYFEEYQECFFSKTDEEIITVFNKEVGNPGWGTARAAFLCSLHCELDRRHIEYSSIGNKDCLCFKYPIQIDENKKITIQINA